MEMVRVTPGEPRAFVKAMGPYAELGIDRVILLPFGPDPVVFVRLVGHVMPVPAEV